MSKYHPKHSSSQLLAVSEKLTLGVIATFVKCKKIPDTNLFISYTGVNIILKEPCLENEVTQLHNYKMPFILDLQITV